jgi:16S rRNA (adenine1518-N6/adenine1519-N6)-dimethyltransferase
VFHPRPRVESVLVQLMRHPAPPVDADFGAMMALARQAFGQRRKMLRRSLAGRVSDAQFEAASVRADARPETLSLHDWSELAIVVGAAGGEPEP